MEGPGANDGGGARRLRVRGSSDSGRRRRRHGGCSTYLVIGCEAVRLLIHGRGDFQEGRGGEAEDRERETSNEGCRAAAGGRPVPLRYSGSLREVVTVRTRGGWQDTQSVLDSSISRSAEDNCAIKHESECGPPRYTSIASAKSAFVFADACRIAAVIASRPPAAMIAVLPEGRCAKQYSANDPYLATSALSA